VGASVLSLSEAQLDQIRKLADEVALREGCRLYDIEFGGGARTLRIYIEREPNGVSIEDCANVSRGLNLLLDVEDPIPGGQYELEVSSPGMERKLTQLWHFERAVGKTVHLRFKNEQNKHQSFEGIVEAVEGSKITIKNNKGSVDIDYPKIEKAKQMFTAPVKGKKR
jgi:ribosome maturation factor RimP